MKRYTVRLAMLVVNCVGSMMASNSGSTGQSPRLQRFVNNHVTVAVLIPLLQTRIGALYPEFTRRANQNISGANSQEVEQRVIEMEPRMVDFTRTLLAIDEVLTQYEQAYPSDGHEGNNPDLGQLRGWLQDYVGLVEGSAGESEVASEIGSDVESQS